jgi:hypothetical protein
MALVLVAAKTLTPPAPRAANQRALIHRLIISKIFSETRDQMHPKLVRRCITS